MCTWACVLASTPLALSTHPRLPLPCPAPPLVIFSHEQNDLKSVELAAANAIKKEAAKDPNKPQEGQQQQQAAAAQQ